MGRAADEGGVHLHCYGPVIAAVVRDAKDDVVANRLAKLLQDPLEKRNVVDRAEAGLVVERHQSKKRVLLDAVLFKDGEVCAKMVTIVGPAVVGQTELVWEGLGNGLLDNCRELKYGLLERLGRRRLELRVLAKFSSATRTWEGSGS